MYVYIIILLNAYCDYTFIIVYSVNKVITVVGVDWVENFRVSKETFVYLCGKLQPYIERQDTRLRKAICVEHRVAITLWCLATCGEYHIIGHLFGIASCTFCVIVHDTCKALVSTL